jgi:type I restriction enzyme S subunit
MKRIKLGEVCEIVSGNTPKTSVEEYWDGDIDWITPAELKDETYIIEESQRKITQIAVQKTGLKPFPQGTVILSSRAPIGKVAIAGKEMYCNQGFKNLICSDRVDSRYLYWYLKGHTDYLNSLGRGATFKEISKTIVENIGIPLPDLNKQIEYANVLKECWDLLSTLKRQVEVYDDLIKARFVEMFENGNYQVEKLGTVCEKITDGTHKTPTYLDEGITFISAKNIVNGELDFTDIKHISEEEYQEIQKRCQTSIYDILLSKSGSLGTPVIVKTEEKLGLFESLAVLKYDRERLLPEFLCEQLKNDRIQRQFTTGTKGVAIKHLHLGVIATIGIIVPPLDEQKTFAAFVHQVDKSKVAVQKALDQTQVLFDSLMQKYFG